EKELVGHNLLFDLQFLAARGFEPGGVLDTLLLSQLLDGPRKGKGYHTLDACVVRHLSRELPKELQRSDWSGTLSAAQLAYAAHDAEVLRPLAEVLLSKVRQAGMGRVAALEMRALPSVAWMAQSGVPFDPDAWGTLAAEAKADAARLAEEL